MSTAVTEYPISYNRLLIAPFPHPRSSNFKGISSCVSGFSLSKKFSK